MCGPACVLRPAEVGRVGGLSAGLSGSLGYRTALTDHPHPLQATHDQPSFPVHSRFEHADNDAEGIGFYRVWLLSTSITVMESS